MTRPDDRIYGVAEAPRAGTELRQHDLPARNLVRTPQREQDVGMIRAPDSTNSEEQFNRWTSQQLPNLNARSDMILSKDFKIKDSLDNLNQITKRMGQVNNDILS